MILEVVQQSRDDFAHAAQFAGERLMDGVQRLSSAEPIGKLETLFISIYYNNCYNALERFMFTLKLTQIGNSVGVILPKEVLARLKLKRGDEVYITESPDGYRITPHSSDFEEQMKVAREIMNERRAVLRELAK